MCTNFSINKLKINKEKDVIIVGRTMELGPDLNSKLFFRPEGYHFTQNPSENFFRALEIQRLGDEEFKLKKGIENIQNLYTWHGIYGFTGMNAFEQNIAADGMNTEGLTTGTMVLAQSEYHEIEKTTNNEYDGKNTVFYFNLSNWILSNCANCQDVIDKLSVNKLVVRDGSKLTNNSNQPDRIKVVNPFEKVPNAMKFHFPVHDAEGNNIVLEYVKGELVITDLGPINVLTNDPLIEWQQTNVLNNYVGISPYNIQNTKGYNEATGKGNNFRCNSFAQGTGFEGLPGSSTPVDRFVRAAMMTNFAFQPDTVEEATTLAFHILNTVDIPMGTSREYMNDAIHDFTQWATVSDLRNKTYSIRMYNSPQVFKVKLDDLNLEKLVNYQKELPVGNKAIDITNDIINHKINDEAPVKETLAFQEN